MALRPRSHIAAAFAAILHVHERLRASARRKPRRPGEPEQRQWVDPLTEGRGTKLSMRRPRTRLITIVAALGVWLMVPVALSGVSEESGSSGIRSLSGAEAVTCFGLAPTIVGTEGPDELAGTPGDDVIVALGGDDYVVSYRGNDRICGGDGADGLYGWFGNDQIDGGAGNDIVAGGWGDDALDGGADIDTVSSECVSPVTSVFPCIPPGIQVDLANGTAQGPSEGTDTLLNFEGISGSDFDDVLLGDDGDNFVIGQGGDDQIDGRGGFDGALYYSAPVDVDLSSGRSVGEGTDELVGLEGALGPPGSTLTGDEHDNTLMGLTPLGSSSSTGVVLRGGAGNDRLLGSSGDDRIFGDVGDDTLEGAEGDDILDGGEGSSDIASFLNGPAVNVSLKNRIADGAGRDRLLAIEDVAGSQFADAIVGDRNANALYGNDGDDEIVAGKGDDALVGGIGTNRLLGGAGWDDCIGGSSFLRCEISAPAPPPEAADVPVPADPSPREGGSTATGDTPGCAEHGCSKAESLFTQLRSVLRQAVDLGSDQAPGWVRGVATCRAGARAHAIAVQPPALVRPWFGGQYAEDAEWTLTLGPGRRSASARSPIAGGNRPNGVPSWRDAATGDDLFQAHWKVPARGEYSATEQVTWSRTGQSQSSPVVFVDASGGKQRFCPARR